MKKNKKTKFIESGLAGAALGAIAGVVLATKPGRKFGKNLISQAKKSLKQPKKNSK